MPHHSQRFLKDWRPCYWEVSCRRTIADQEASRSALVDSEAQDVISQAKVFRCFARSIPKLVPKKIDSSASSSAVIPLNG